MSVFIVGLTKLLASKSLQLKPGPHFAVSRSALHVHRLHESAIIVDMHLETRHRRGHLALAACTDMFHHLVALVKLFRRHKHVRHDIDIFNF
ncbi:hypothetical protein FSU_1374 [Fibrobacter succinogenes subsp. succinogenes S85]|uniref:Uncharacterized protein n=1 Tax=Fibrobacter succinogenes (strain ATCC 19169 / S85) TaxID=59374 RepID=D9SA39_FIBSS|nr:hypothetical protein FSU_1374 [Fibrobacter succinogenes subsp. succinogenes S85]